MGLFVADIVDVKGQGSDLFNGVGDRLLNTKMISGVKVYDSTGSLFEYIIHPSSDKERPCVVKCSDSNSDISAYADSAGDSRMLILNYYPNGDFSQRSVPIRINSDSIIIGQDYDSYTLIYISFNGFIKKYFIAESIDEIDGTLSFVYRSLVNKSTIDNGEDNYAFDECHWAQELFSRYYSQSFVCPAPMDSTINRRAFPNIYKFNNYAFLSYNAGNSHQVNALLPHVLEFTRSNDKWETSGSLTIDCVNDGGTMREIDSEADGFFPWNYQFAYADKMYAIIPTLLLTANPPVLSSDFSVYKTFICSSEDYGETWSELTELADNTYVSSSKPIIVGDEIWYPCYKYTGDVETTTSHILRWNYVTNSAGTNTQIDSSWTNLRTSEPCLLEHTAGRYMTMVRVNYNDNYPGAETSHRGTVEAYSTDGLDWTDYTFRDEGVAYPNQPHLYKFGDYIYHSRGYSVMYGTVVDNEVSWVNKITGSTPWYQNYIYTYRTFQRNGTALTRYDPRTGQEDQSRNLDLKGSIDFETWDENSETLMATVSYVLDSGVYIAEPWVCMIKRNGVGAGPTYNERLIFVGEIPGDGDVSNTIKIYNFFAEVGDAVAVEWLTIDDAPTTTITGAINAQYFIDFTAGEAVTEAKFVYEIIK